MKFKEVFSGLFRSWWVIAFMLLCLVLYEQSLKNRESQRLQLKQQWKQLQIDKKSELAKQKDLKLQINSQSDPAWVELILMKGLGLVPENTTKIYFEK
jgi:hypothetical protein